MMTFKDLKPAYAISARHREVRWRRHLPLAGILFALMALAVMLCSTASLSCIQISRRSTEVNVSIDAAAAQNVGSLHVELIYNPSLLQAVAVEAGTLTGESLFQYNLEIQGQAVIGVVDSNGINGSGSIALVKFTTLGSGDAVTQLRLENIIAHHATTLEEISTEARPGDLTFSAARTSLTPPLITFLPFEE